MTMIDFKQAASLARRKRVMHTFNQYLGIEKIPEGMECWISCSKCGYMQWLAYGFNAVVMGQTRRFEIAIKMNWQIAPIPLCRDCIKRQIEPQSMKDYFECPECGKARHKDLEASVCDNPNCSDSVKF
jgi:predicted RNA-binding Zn-ribbon protein involved in translation (DUF1610 family)